MRTIYDTGFRKTDHTVRMLDSMKDNVDQQQVAVADGINCTFSNEYCMRRQSIKLNKVYTLSRVCVLLFILIFMNANQICLNCCPARRVVVVASINKRLNYSLCGRSSEMNAPLIGWAERAIKRLIGCDGRYGGNGRSSKLCFFVDSVFESISVVAWRCLCAAYEAAAAGNQPLIVSVSNDDITPGCSTISSLALFRIS